jgi:hypothetical protein
MCGGGVGNRHDTSNGVQQFSHGASDVNGSDRDG